MEFIIYIRYIIFICNGINNIYRIYNIYIFIMELIIMNYIDHNFTFINVTNISTYYNSIRTQIHLSISMQVSQYAHQVVLATAHSYDAVGILSASGSHRFATATPALPGVTLQRTRSRQRNLPPVRARRRFGRSVS